jgi:hypothetical protein
MKVNLSNSIYQRNGSSMGLTVKDGMLINNRPTSTTGIQKAIDITKSLKRAEKISTMSEAVALGGLKEDMMSGDCCS